MAKKKFLTPNDLIGEIKKDRAINTKVSAPIMDEAAAFLRQKIISGINSWYESYQSKSFNSNGMYWSGRTGDWAASLSKKITVKRIGNRIQAKIKWNKSAWHKSVFKGGSKGFVPTLFEDGWHLKNGKGLFSPQRAMFDYFEPSGGLKIVEKAAAATKQKYGNAIVISWGDRIY